LSLRFILGRAGSGKSFTCLSEMAGELEAFPEGHPLILLVPEQASFQAERDLVVACAGKGFMRAQVLSFRRLAYRVLREAGGAARAHIGELGKRCVLRRLLQLRQGELKVFQSPATRAGFADSLARAVGEMKTYCIGPEDLAAPAAELRKAGAALLADKLDDLRLLFNDLEQFLASRFIDPDDYLSLLAGRLPRAATTAGAEVWVDGFTGFTPQEYGVLAALLHAARRVNVSLCIDDLSLAGAIDESDPFYPVRETYEQLCVITANEGMRVDRPVLLSDSAPRFRSAAIAHLERHFFRRPAPPLAAGGAEVTVAYAANRTAEVEGAAREMIRLARDSGYRWREMVVLSRDLSLYAGLVANIFADYGIPAFIDQKRPALHHALPELVRSAFEVAVRDWTYDPVFRYLKTDLAALTREEVDILENYVLAHGIRGGRWTDGRPWQYRQRRFLEEDDSVSGASEAEADGRELAEVNRIRDRATGSLGRFCTAVREAVDGREITAALFDLLTGLAVPEQLERWSAAAEKEGRLEEAQEHAQVWVEFVELLDQLVEVIGDEAISLEEYAAVLDEGLAHLRLSLIPPGLDQVVVGSLDRSRSPGARSAIVLGVSEGLLPARSIEQGILTDAEREKLAAAGLKFAPGARRRSFEEQSLIYVALTRAGERLTLSCPLADDEGGATAPSPVLAQIRALLPGAAEAVWPVEPGEGQSANLDFVTRPGRTLSHLAGRLREARAGRPVDPLWRDLYTWFVTGEHRDSAARTLSGLFYQNSAGRLPGRLSRALYGRKLVTGVSGIEKFRSCPFAYFLTYGLKLRDRAVFKLSPPDLGQFFHAALKLFGEDLQEKGLDWGKLSRENCRHLADEVVDRLAPRLLNEILLSTARQRYLTGKLKRIVRRAATVLAEHGRRGCFRPVGLELAFAPGGGLPAATFVLPDGSEMVLTGRIDRVDTAPGEDGEIYLRIIDYKSGRPDFRLSDVWHGLKLQLLTYLNVALDEAEKLVGRSCLPAAILYFHIHDPVISAAGPMPADAVAKEILKSLKMKGLVLADPAVIEMLDPALSGHSDLVPVQIKKGGGLGEHSAAISLEQFELLRSHLRSQLLSAGEEIMSGTVDISPYRQGKFRCCQYCDYRPVCFFDVLVEGNRYRILHPEKDAAVLERLAELAKEEKR